MSKVLRALGVLFGLVTVVGVSFALYSHFLVDYSLESLEAALTATETKSVESSQMTQKVYKDLVRDLALEEAAREDGDAQNLALLELAARSLDETKERAGSARARMYLSKTLESKSPNRHVALQWLDRIYRALRNFYFELNNLYQYFKRTIAGKETGPEDVSSYLLLTQAEEKEREWKLDEAVDLYRRFLSNYAGHPEEVMVRFSLAHLLMKQKNYLEAERILKGILLNPRGLENYEIASNLMARVQEFKQRENEIDQLQRQLVFKAGTREEEPLLLQLGLLYIYSYNILDAQQIFKRLTDAETPAVRQKAKFYLGWVYKLQAQYDQGEKVLLELSEDEDLDSNMDLGLKAQLADIYYQKEDKEKSAEYYQKIAEESGKKEEAKAAREAWSALADTEQGVIYYLDLGETAKAESSFARLSGQFTDSDQLESAVRDASKIDLRSLAFTQLKTGKVYEAWDLFKKKVKVDPRDAWAHSGLATTYVLLADLYMAEQHGLEGYKLRPDEYTASVYGYVLGYLSRYEESVELYKAALKKSESYIPASYNLATLYLFLADYGPGLELLDKLREDFKNHPNIMSAKIHNNIGYALWHTGKHDEAIEMFKQSLAMAPEFKDAKVNLSLAVDGKAPSALHLEM